MGKKVVKKLPSKPTIKLSSILPQIQCVSCKQYGEPVFQCPDYIFNKIGTTFDFHLAESTRKNLHLCLKCSFHIDLLLKFITQNICTSLTRPKCFMCKTSSIVSVVGPGEFRGELESSPLKNQLEPNGKYYTCVCCLYQLRECVRYKQFFNSLRLKNMKIVGGDKDLAKFPIIQLQKVDHMILNMHSEVFVKKTLNGTKITSSSSPVVYLGKKRPFPIISPPARPATPPPPVKKVKFSPKIALLPIPKLKLKKKSTPPPPPPTPPPKPKPKPKPVVVKKAPVNKQRSKIPPAPLKLINPVSKSGRSKIQAKRRVPTKGERKDTAGNTSTPGRGRPPKKKSGNNLLPALEMFEDLDLDGCGGEDEMITGDIPLENVTSNISTEQITTTTTKEPEPQQQQPAQQQQAAQQQQPAQQQQEQQSNGTITTVVIDDDDDEDDDNDDDDEELPQETSIEEEHDNVNEINESHEEREKEPVADVVNGDDEELTDLSMETNKNNAELSPISDTSFNGDVDNQPEENFEEPPPTTLPDIDSLI